MEPPARPKDVGILAMAVYFPPSFVDQVALEAHDGVSTGKYTIGLGQDALGFCCDQEDVISMSLTVTQQLLETTRIDPANVGRLEVGSETVIDKSKSIKTYLMSLFEGSGNGDIEGIDSSNACYGGTAALFNAVNWVESASWDGRYAIVVAADSAVYAEGNARPTGGAGSVAMLIGPDAPLALERGLSGSYMAHVFDFYKPKLASEYPVVDGKLTQTCFLKALDKCYNSFCDKYAKATGSPFSLAEADYVVTHAPYNKLVQKTFARLLYNDFLRHGSEGSPLSDEVMQPFADVSREESYVSKELEKVLMTASKEGYKEKTAPATYVPKLVGNMYTASLYAGLASLVTKKTAEMVGKRVLLFSYGSGLASSLFSVRARETSDERFSLPAITKAVALDALLASRVKVSPEEFVKTMHVMETRYGAADFEPIAKADILRPGTFFLNKVDDLYRRFYSRKTSPDSKLAVPEHASSENTNGYAHAVIAT